MLYLLIILNIYEKRKGKINRKMLANAFLYGDGFILGLASLLCLLRENPHYKTLHWDV